MITSTLPQDFEIPCVPRIETISESVIRSFDYCEDKPSVYYLSAQDIEVATATSIKTSKRISNFEEYFCMKAVQDLYISINAERDRLQFENVNLPNQQSIKYALSIISELSELNIYPKVITPSIEEGLCLIFQKAQYQMYLEFYNTGEIGYIIEDTKLRKTIENEDIESVDLVSNIIERFFH